MTRYPLLFGFRDLVAGNGFVAVVALNGRALLVDEGDGFWMYGVNPGALAGGGQGPGEAQYEFRSVYRSVLFDFAREVESFEDFRQKVEQFFHQTNEANVSEWEEAVAQVRSGQVQADWLPRRAAESRFGVDVVLLEHPEPSANQLDAVELAAA